MKMESWFLLLDVILRDMHKRSGYTLINGEESMIEILNDNPFWIGNFGLQFDEVWGFENVVSVSTNVKLHFDIFALQTAKRIGIGNEIQYLKI